ncbi:hypothetical protein KDAU_00140 [Dictyobacter aurantiacus]|uniref:Uncharacterized protein n=1 Tax=Dictyobacter aurantiacus TaxID=1936993 RepID=A0A401Z778_9CHLR|nr:hypothetical protein KDAU_00140 [Dictyobacter aurantiacus]
MQYVRGLPPLLCIHKVKLLQSDQKRLRVMHRIMLVAFSSGEQASGGKPRTYCGIFSFCMLLR